MRFATDTRGYQGIIDEVQIYDIEMNKEQIETVLTGAVVADIGDQQQQLPAAYYLGSNYPNPFNNNTNIRYALMKPDFVKLTVYDILGQEITVLVHENQKRGIYTINFDGNMLASGIYLYQLQVGRRLMEAKKMVLIK